MDKIINRSTRNICFLNTHSKILVVFKPQIPKFTVPSNSYKMSNPNQNQAPKAGSHAKSEPTIRRTTIAENGAITTKSVPLSALRKDAMDLSNNAPASLLLTREAAMRVTEVAINTAIANTWTNLVEPEKKKISESSAKKQSDNKMSVTSNKADPKPENKQAPALRKSTTTSNQPSAAKKEHPLATETEKTNPPNQSTPRRTPSASIPAAKKTSQNTVPKTKSSATTNDSKKKNLNSKGKSSTKNNVKKASSETPK